MREWIWFFSLKETHFYPGLLQLNSSLRIAWASEAQLLETTILLPTCVSPEADLRKQLACLEAKLSTMQEHLAQLALEVLHDHAQRYERRLV